MTMVSSATAQSADMRLAAGGRTKQEIMGKWQRYTPMARTFTYMGNQDIYEERPSAQVPFKAGKLKREYILDGIKAVNFVRYLAGLPDDIEPDWSLELQQQTGALVNALNDELTHFPAKPAGMDETQFQLGAAATKSSNLFSGDPTLYSNVLGYMSDSDTSNIDRLGHRRWIINPMMKKTMMGFVRLNKGQPYATLYAFDQSRPQSEVDYSYIAWPAAGYFPAEMLQPDDAWSVSLNPKKYNSSRISEIRVKLSREGDGKVWTFDSSNQDKNGRYFNVETNGYGIPFCIIFRPEGIKQLQENDRFNVHIEGLYDSGGRAASVDYATDFFHLTKMKKFRASSLRLQPGETVQLKAYSSTGEESGAQEGVLVSDHPEVASVDSSGRIQGIKDGQAIIAYRNYFDQVEGVYVDVRENGSERVSGWAMDAYTRGKGNGIISSYLDHDYQSPIDRTELAAALVSLYENISGKPLESPVTPFTDIDNEYVSKAVKLGLIQGTAPGKFSPWAEVTRQDAASLMLRLYKQLGALPGSLSQQKWRWEPSKRLPMTPLWQHGPSPTYMRRFDWAWSAVLATGSSIPRAS